MTATLIRTARIWLAIGILAVANRLAEFAERQVDAIVRDKR